MRLSYDNFSSYSGRRYSEDETDRSVHTGSAKVVMNTDNCPFPKSGWATAATATAATATEEFSQSIQAPSSTHPGISYPVKVNPSLRSRQGIPSFISLRHRLPFHSARTEYICGYVLMLLTGSRCYDVEAHLGPGPILGNSFGPCWAHSFVGPYWARALLCPFR